MTEEEFLLRLNQAQLFHDEVAAMRDFIRAEIAAGRADPAGFSRDFRTRFRAPYEWKDVLETVKSEVTAVASTLEVRSHISITETLELNEKDRTYVIMMITERPLTESEELAVPICPHGVPILHHAVTPFDVWAPYSVGGNKRLPGVCGQSPNVS